MPEFPESIELTLDRLRSHPYEADWWMHFFLDGGSLVGSDGYVGQPRDGVVEIGYEIARGVDLVVKRLRIHHWCVWAEVGENFVETYWFPIVLARGPIFPYAVVESIFVTHPVLPYGAVLLTFAESIYL